LLEQDTAAALAGTLTAASTIPFERHGLEIKVGVLGAEPSATPCPCVSTHKAQRRSTIDALDL
jgi:hypothetical protein